MRIAALPTDAARFPYTLNIEKKNVATRISRAIVMSYNLAKPVMMLVTKMNAMQKSIPFLLCTMGPGASVRLTHIAPSDMDKPSSKKPK